MQGQNHAGMKKGLHGHQKRLLRDARSGSQADSLTSVPSVLHLTNDSRGLGDAVATGSYANHSTVRCICAKTARGWDITDVEGGNRPHGSAAWQSQRNWESGHSPARGEPPLPNLIRGAIDDDGQVKHILDWWHISMRVRHVEAAVQGLVQTQGFTGNPVLFRRPANGLRWWLWHGRARVAETYLKGLMLDCARLEAKPLAVNAAAAPLLRGC